MTRLPNDDATPTREALIQLVQQIMSGGYQDNTSHDAAMEQFARAVPHPRASGLIYYPSDEFDREPTAEQIVDRALAYRAIEL